MSVDIPVHVSGVTLVTPRLTLRACRADDLEAFFAYASVPDVGERAGWPHHTSVEESRGILGEIIRGDCVFALVPHDAGVMCGSVGVHVSGWADQDPELSGLRVKEIGYVLARSHWGRGLMPEAVRAVIDWAFGSLGLDALTIGHFPQNDRSRRVIEKCGFEYRRSGVYEAYQLNTTFDELCYVLMNPAPNPRA